ncbi:MAG: hypothetical protein IKR90_02145 [Clostridia bacterium]|nr:hypothetical protein [Clostridia bacterium]
MKNKLTAAVSIAICLLMVISVMAACSKNKPLDGTSETIGSNESWSGADDNYEPVDVTDVELVGIVSEALGEEASGFNGDLSSLTDEQMEKVKTVAEQKGYIVEEDEKGEPVVKKEANVEVSKPSDDKVREIYSKAKVEEGTTVTPEQYKEISKAAQEKGATAITDKQGNVTIIETTVIPTTTTTRPSTSATTAAAQGGKTKPTASATVISSTRGKSNGTAPTYSVAPVETVPVKVTGITAGAVNSFGNGAHCFFAANAPTSDGVVSVGNTLVDAKGKKRDSSSALIAKYESSGKRAWYSILAGDDITKYNDVCILTDGSIIAVGETIAEDLVADSLYRCKGTVEGVISKYNEKGKLQWTHLFGGSESDMIYAVSATPDGGFVIAGETESKDFDFKGATVNQNNGFVAKLDANGNRLWVKALGGSLTCAVKDVATSSAGITYAVIETLCKDGDFASFDGAKNGRKYNVVMRLSEAGELNWVKNYWDVGAFQISHITCGNDSGCLIAGSYAAGQTKNEGTLNGIYNGGEPGTYDGIIIKIGPTGETKWKCPLIGFQNDYITDITPVTGGYAVTGYTTSTNRDFAFKNLGDFDSFIGVVSEYGKLLSIKSFGGSASDRAQAVCAAPGGTSVFVSGVTLPADNDFSKVDAVSNGTDAVAFEYKFDLATNAENAG